MIYHAIFCNWVLLQSAAICRLGARGNLCPATICLCANHRHAGECQDLSWHGCCVDNKLDLVWSALKAWKSHFFVGWLQETYLFHFCLLPPNVAFLIRWITLSPPWALEWHWVWLYLWCRPYLLSWNTFQSLVGLRSVEVWRLLRLRGCGPEARTSKNVSEVISKDLQDLLVQFIMSR